MEIFLWQIRKELNVNLKELSERTGISSATLNRIENGKTSPRLKQLKSIAKALNVKISNLYEDEYK